jgi:hypothetical protein
MPLSSEVEPSTERCTKMTGMVLSSAVGLSLVPGMRAYKKLAMNKGHIGRDHSLLTGADPNLSS